MNFLVINQILISNNNDVYGKFWEKTWFLDGINCQTTKKNMSSASKSKGNYIKKIIYPSK